jgi:hypothetical protein
MVSAAAGAATPIRAAMTAETKIDRIKMTSSKL